MKSYSEPELKVVRFDITDSTNFGGDNEVSAGALFPTIGIDW